MWWSGKIIFPPLRLPAHSSSRGGSKHLHTSLGPTACGEAMFKEKKGFPSLCLLAHPVWGWVASGARRKGAAYAGSYKNGATYFQRAPPSFTIYHLPFLRGPLPPPRGPPPPVKRWEARLRKKGHSATTLTCPPPFGGGWRAERDGRGRLTQEAIKMAPHISKGRHLLIYHLPFTIHNFPEPPATYKPMPLP